MPSGASAMPAVPTPYPPSAISHYLSHSLRQQGSLPLRARGFVARLPSARIVPMPFGRPGMLTRQSPEARLRCLIYRTSSNRIGGSR